MGNTITSMFTSTRPKHPVLKGRNLTLEEFTPDKINAKYLEWLNNPIVNYYTRRRHMSVQGFEEALAYIRSQGSGEAVFAIQHPEHGHVGNISYGPIEWEYLRSQLGIMIGEHNLWSRGIGTEAVYLVTKFLFTEKKLHRVEAGTANIAFVKLAEKLGWTIEGVERDRFRLDDSFVSETLLSQLHNEFRVMAELEP